MFEYLKLESLGANAVFSNIGPQPRSILLTAALFLATLTLVITPFRIFT